MAMEIETDISVGTSFEGVEKGLCDRLIRRLLAVCPRAMHLVRIVKLWAKVEKLNKAYDGFLNSLGWTLLVLQYFLDRGEFSTANLYNEEPNERGNESDPNQLPPQLHPAPTEKEEIDDASIHVPDAGQVADFFAWVGDWETWWPKERPVALEGETQGYWALSLVDGQVVEAPAGTERKFPDQCDFFLEDPGVKIE